MAALPFVATQAYLSINAVLLHTWCEAVLVDVDGDEVDITNFGSSAKQVLLPGILKGKVTVSIFQDYQAGGPNATLWPLVNTQTTIEIRPTQAARSVTNPAWTGTVQISKYQPINEKIGDASKISMAWPISGGLTMQTA